MPRSFPDLIFRHWLKLVYFLELLLIAGSTLLLAKEVQQFALTAFGITAAVHLAVCCLRDMIESKNRWLELEQSDRRGDPRGGDRDRRPGSVRDARRRLRLERALDRQKLFAHRVRARLELEDAGARIIDSNRRHSVSSGRSARIEGLFQ